MSIQLQPVVMAGGSGTRLWPLSRSGFPKQFLAIDGRVSLFQQSVERLAAAAGRQHRDERAAGRGQRRTPISAA